MSGEHLVSKAILNETVSVKGLPWCKNEAKRIGKASLTAKNLCKIHNEQLSPLDAEAKKFVASCRCFFDEMATDEMRLTTGIPPARYVLDGALLERWFCKTLINIAEHQSRVFSIPYSRLADHVFDGKPFDKPFGLSLAVGNGQAISWGSDDTISIEPLGGPDQYSNELAAGLFSFRSFKLVFLVPVEFQVIRDGKLPLGESKSAWAGLQLNWHNEEISGPGKPGRERDCPRLVFEWR